jgi:hypothetical protein
MFTFIPNNSKDEKELTDIAELSTEYLEYLAMLGCPKDLLVRENTSNSTV